MRFNTEVYCIEVYIGSMYMNSSEHLKRFFPRSNVGEENLEYESRLKIEDLLETVEVNTKLEIQTER